MNRAGVNYLLYASGEIASSAKFCWKTGNDRSCRRQTAETAVNAASPQKTLRSGDHSYSVIASSARLPQKGLSFLPDSDTV